MYHPSARTQLSLYTSIDFDISDSGVNEFRHPLILAPINSDVYYFDVRLFRCLLSPTNAVCLLTPARGGLVALKISPEWCVRQYICTRGCVPLQHP